MNKRLKKYLLYLKRFLDPKFTTPFYVTLFVFICIKSYVFDMVIVTSPSMNNTLEKGEMVFVSKLFTLQKNDLVRISLPLSVKDSGVASAFIIKRLVGMPGDTVEIRDSKLRVNGIFVPENSFFLHNYIAKIKTQADSSVFSKAGITEKFLIDDSCVYMVSLTVDRFNELKEQKTFFSLVSNAEDSADFDSNVFPYNNQYKWNEDYFGPVYIPKKGDTLRLDTSSIKLYGRIIADLEHNSLKAGNDEILVNEKPANFYVVKKNYYFVTGDNFDNSIDSRNWGLIPENKIRSKLLFKH